mgnify:FL=1
MKKKIISALIIICLLIAFGTLVTVEWLYDTFGHLSMDEIVFHLKVPMEGTNTDIVWTYIKQCSLKIIIPTALISSILIYPMMKDVKKIKTSQKKRTIIISSGIAVMILIISTERIVNATDIKEYIGSLKNESNLIETEYVDPKEVEIEFPEQKRNLIYILLESMETTYYSKENGGLSEEELIPEIAELAKENINFSNTEKLGGANSLYGTTWTTGAMVAQTAGIPLKLPFNGNLLGKYSTFLGGAYTLGEILNDNGYNNFLILGSEAEFGGRKKLFEQHGNYEIWDHISAQQEQRVEGTTWWGYTDNLLFEFAKEKILELSEKDEPFNFTMLTADTHFPDGYLCEDCEEKWDEQYKNVISCSSKRVGELVEWLKQQDFYDNTTIVISGDHLTMQQDFFEDEDYNKTVLNVIINSEAETENMKNRQYSTMDLYPTTLSALGANIKGNKLALGVNLFSDEQTLIEKYGLENVNNELMKKSVYYDKNILVSKARKE